MEGKGTRLKLRGGIWYVVVQGNSRGTSTRTGSREQAEQFLAAFIQQRKKDQLNVAEELTIDQLLDDYLKEHARPNIASIEQAEIACDYLRLHFGRDMLIVEILEDDIATYIHARRTCALKRTRDPRPAGDGTIRRELGTLAAAFNHAVKKRRIAATDVPHIAPPSAPPPKVLWLTPADEARVLDALPQLTEGEGRLSRIYRFVTLALDTAARKEALETLTWRQVDLAGGIIDLNPPGRTQTKKRRPNVPISTRLRGILMRAHEERTSAYVLDHPGSIRRSMETLATKLDMEWVTSHVFRHTWATRAARAGVSMVDIADFMGDDPPCANETCATFPVEISGQQGSHDIRSTAQSHGA